MPVTLKDVAQEAGVSVATASLGLANHARVNQKTRERIREASLRVGYCTTAELAAKRLGSGFRFLFAGIGSRGGRHLRSGLVSTLMMNPHETGYRIEIAAIEADQPPAELAEEIRRLAADSHGVALYGTVDLDLLERIAADDLPTVLIGNIAGETAPPVQLSAASVGFDHTAMGAYATRLLLKHGHRAIGLITTKDAHGLYYAGWQNGYHSVMSQANLPTLIDENWLEHEGNIPLDANGDIPTGFVLPDLTYLGPLRDLLAKQGHELKPSQVILGGNTLNRDQVTHWPAILSDTDLLVRTAMAKLVDLNTQPMVSFQTISLPWEKHNLHLLA